MIRVQQVFWTVTALDALFFAVLLVMTLTQRSHGDGGREMALFFFIAVPSGVLLAAALLFLYVDSTVVRVIALFIVTVPGLFFGGGQLRSLWIDRVIAEHQNGTGYFDEGAMKAMGAAVVLRDVEALKRVGRGVDVNTVGDRGMTLLALAAERHFNDAPDTTDGRELQVVQVLLELGAKPNQGLDTAAKLKRSDLLRLLLAAGADPNLHADGEQPLVFRWLSVMTPETLRLLAAHGLDLNATSYGDPFAVTATIYRRWDLLAVLIELGADTARPRPDGRTVAGELSVQLAEEAQAGRPAPPDLLQAKALLDARRSAS